MKSLHRRQFLHLAATAAPLVAMPWSAAAQSYPARQVRVVVGFPPGGPADLLARPIAQWLSDRLGQPFIIDNRPGASGNIAVEAVIRAPADGYTVLVVVPGNAIAHVLYDKLGFNLMRDTLPIAGMSNGPMIMVINPALPVHSVPEFIAYAKANPGRINFASPGKGATIHMCGELFKLMTGVDMVHVPYRGNLAAVTDLIAGQVQLMFVDAPTSLQHVKAGTLRALAVTTPTRSEILPELPSVGEFLPGFEASNWFGIVAPKGTPADIVEKLNREINAGLSDPKVKARFAELGVSPLPGSPADFERFMAAAAGRWAGVIQATGIKGD